MWETIKSATVIGIPGGVLAGIPIALLDAGPFVAMGIALATMSLLGWLFAPAELLPVSPPPWRRDPHSR